jgi:hypothetical protein
MAEGEGRSWTAHELLKQLPGSIHFGASVLCEIAAKLEPLPTRAGVRG